MYFDDKENVILWSDLDWITLEYDSLNKKQIKKDEKK